MTIPQPEAVELPPIEHVMRAFYDGWPSFKAWWEATDNSYGGKMSFDDLPPEPFEAAFAAWNRRRAPPPAADHEAEIAALTWQEKRKAAGLMPPRYPSLLSEPEENEFTRHNQVERISNELGNSIVIQVIRASRRNTTLICIDGPDSFSTNLLTDIEAEKLLELLWRYFLSKGNDPVAIMRRAALPITEEDRVLVRNILVVTAAETEASREKATLPDARKWLASHAQRLREIAAKIEGK